MGKRPKIRHLAIMTLDPERLAKFYEQTFQMTRLTNWTAVFVIAAVLNIVAALMALVVLKPMRRRAIA
jgi:hypothetical protein